MSASEAARAVEDAAAAGDTVQALYKTSIAASRAATARPQGLSDPPPINILGMHGRWAAVPCRSKAGGACLARLAACAVIKGKTLCCRAHTSFRPGHALHPACQELHQAQRSAQGRHSCLRPAWRMSCPATNKEALCMALVAQATMPRSRFYVNGIWNLAP